jgi:hypothetical protein
MNFNKENFIKIIKASALISTNIQSIKVRSYIADHFFRRLLLNSKNDSTEFMKEIAKIVQKNQPIHHEDNLTQSELISIFKETPCKDLIDNNFQLASDSPGEIFLKNQFQFKNTQEFLFQLLSLCSEECPSIKDTRETITRDRSKLRMDTTTGEGFTVDMSEEKIHESIDRFLTLVSRQNINDLKSTFIRYKDQAGIDAGGLKRDFYDKVLEVLKDDQQKLKLQNYNPEMLGKILAMQVGVENGIPGFGIDLNESYYQKLIDHTSQPINHTQNSFKLDLLKEFQGHLCSEEPSDKIKIKFFLSGLSHPQEMTGNSNIFHVKKNKGPIRPERIVKLYNEFFEGIFSDGLKTKIKDRVLSDKNLSDVV